MAMKGVIVFASQEAKFGKVNKCSRKAALLCLQTPGKGLGHIERHSQR